MLLRSGFPLNTIGWEQGLTCSLTVSVGPLAGGEDRVAEEADVGGGKLLRHVALAVYLTGVRHLVENNDTLHLERKQKQLSAFFSTAALSVLSVLALCVLVLSLLALSVLALCVLVLSVLARPSVLALCVLVGLTNTHC